MRIGMLLHMLGLSSLFGGAFITVYMFSKIVSKGSFLAVEPCLLILYLEVLFAVYGLVYSIYLFYLFKKFLGGKR